MPSYSVALTCFADCSPPCCAAASHGVLFRRDRWHPAGRLAPVHHRAAAPPRSGRIDYCGRPVDRKTIQQPDAAAAPAAEGPAGGGAQARAAFEAPREILRADQVGCRVFHGRGRERGRYVGLRCSQGSGLGAGLKNTFLGGLVHPLPDPW